MAESNEIPHERMSLTVVVTTFLLASIPLAIAGAVLAGVSNQDVHRCTTQLMVKPAPFANRSKEELLHLMPTTNVFKSILTSDRVTKMAFDRHLWNQHRKEFFSDSRIDVSKYVKSEPLSGETVKDVELWEKLPHHEGLSLFRSYVEDSVWLAQVNEESETLLILMHVDHRDSEICQVISKSLLDSLQSYFQEEKKSAIASRIRSVSYSIEILHPKHLEIENRYRTFKRDAPLLWTSGGSVVNPHLKEMERIEDRITSQKHELNHRKLELSVLEAFLSGKSKGSDASSEQAVDSDEKTMPEETPNDKADGMEARLLAIETILQWQEKRITELKEQWASEKSGAARFSLYEVEEKNQRREIERIAPLMEQLETQMLKLQILDPAADIQVIKLSGPSEGNLNGSGKRRMWFGAGLGAGLGLLLASLAVHSMSVDSKRRRLAESPA